MDIKHASTREERIEELPPLSVKTMIGLNKDAVRSAKSGIEVSVLRPGIILAVYGFVQSYVGNVQLVWGNSNSMRVCDYSE